MAPQSDLRALLDLTVSTRALLAQFLTSLSSPSATSTLPPNPPNPLHVLRDSAALLKAQTTKLSLLLINKPFTASAITKVLREIMGTVLPAMMSGVEICQPGIWGRLLSAEAKVRVRNVMREMDGMVAEVGEAAQQELSGKEKSVKNRDSLASTGVVWAACDRVTELEGLGVGGLAVRKAEQYRDTIKDAIEELKEWGEDDEDDEEGFENGESEGEGDRDSVEDIFAAANRLPTDRKDLRELLDKSLNRLKKVDMLYAALTKRRLKTFAPDVASEKANVLKLDELIDALKQLPEIVDELASAFYDLDTDEINTVLQRCLSEARDAAELVKTSWEGKEDEFTAWAGKWIEAVK
ncbi:hypothetical protein H2203_000042 [Taxawa tesnikishii (nom. ined.)]|nr:hypothetical protein H2203_000042 [Dothideales sp. JES 119]